MLETGIILIWSGAIVNIPTGFVLCDGNNSTPDLRDKFVMGAGATYNPDDSGGSATHTHTFSSNTHNHSISAGAAIGSGTAYYNSTGNNVVTGTTDAASTLPPYYALAFIMKT